MRVDYQVNTLYDDAIKQVVSSAEAWKAVCKLTGRLYRYEFDNILMVYMQRPNATLVADFDTWRDPRIGRYVKRGSKGIAIFPSRALKPHLRYVFDIADTGGREGKLTWELDEATREAYSAFLGNTGENISAEMYLKDFTENRIGVIMDSEFGERITELIHLAGTKRILVDDKTQAITAEEVLRRSVEYTVFTRCGFDISPEKQDFSFITAFYLEEEVYRLGSLVSDISCEVLRSIARELRQMERSIADGREDDVSRGRERDVVSESHITGGKRIYDEFGQVRSESGGVSEGESQGEIPNALSVREAGGEDERSGGGSPSDDGRIRAGVSEEESTERSQIYDGNVDAEETGESICRRDCDAGSGTEVSLEERELKSELEEIDSSGRPTKGSLEQASFFSGQNADRKLPEKYTYLVPKQELVVPHDYIREVLLRGGEFAQGKRRIYALFATVDDPKERVKGIKKEYGQGGASWPIEKYGLHGYDTYHGNGIRFQWRDEEGEKEGYLKWSAIERELSVLIMTGEYYQPSKNWDADVVPSELWQEPMDAFFNDGLYVIATNIALNEVLQRELPMSSKISFVERVYRPGLFAFSAKSSFKNQYGRCEIDRYNWGISVEFFDANHIKWRTELDWQDCTAYLMSMISDGVYDAKGAFSTFQELPATEMRVNLVPIFKEDVEAFLSGTSLEQQKKRMEAVEHILQVTGREEIKVSWDNTQDVITATDDTHVWRGRELYKYIRENCLQTDAYGRDNRVSWRQLDQFKYDEVTSLDLQKEKFVFRKTLEEVECSQEELIRQEESLWQEALKAYFNEEIQYIAVKTMLYDIFTTNMSFDKKVSFLREVYGKERDTFAMSYRMDGAYGEILFLRDEDGVTVTYARPDGTKGEYKVDYKYCASLILHMIEENEYLSEEIFERFKTSPESFQAMPWFMDIYRVYKERIGLEPEFEALELELASETEPPESQEVHAEKVEKDIFQINVERKAVKEVLPMDGEQKQESNKESKATFPEALKQVEAMEEDLREVLELYLQGCASIHPYLPFLYHVYKSGLSKEDKLYFLKCLIHRRNQEEAYKTYHNNAYNLIEYTSTGNSFTADYPNRHGERKKAEVTYEQIYSIMEYLIRAELLTTKTRIETYEKEFIERPYEKKSALEKQFCDKLQNQKARNMPGNFKLENLEQTKAGPKTRYQWNIDAIRLLKQIELENRTATTEEQKILAKYVGWGGIAQAFDEKNEGWKKEYEELKSLLSRKEYADALESVNTAFYTSPEIIKAIYQALSQFDFKQGSILEPSMGIGHFFGALPDSMKDSKLYGVEKDSVSGRIARLLYPKAQIKIEGFENTSYPDNFFDVAVGNIPFGDYKLYDTKYNKQNFRIHDYFLAKTLDKVRPGGIVAFITSIGTMDKANPAIRKYLAERAELLGAIRLPNTAFKDSAGTDVTSDILFFQKRESKIITEPDWVHLGMTENGIAVNSYFAEHQEMMLGTMEFDTRMFGKDSKYTGCFNHEDNFDLKAALQKAVSNLKGQITDIMELNDAGEEAAEWIDADPDVKNFTFRFVEGKLYYRENSKMYRKEFSALNEERIRLLDEIRSITRQLIFIQSEGCSEEELSFQQKLLNEKYDTYIRKHGPINSRSSRQAFQDDADYPLLCSLEVVDEDGNVKKADMFYKQTIRSKHRVERVETASEALQISVCEFGKVNLPFMLSIYEPDISKILKELPEKEVFSEQDEAELKRAALCHELQGIIFLDPMEYNELNRNMGWKTADEYLSGNVREKLHVAKAFAKEQGVLFSGNVQALTQIQPTELNASEIEVRVGTTWIEPEDYEQFLYELLNTPRRARAVRNKHYSSGIQVKYNVYSQNWYIENKSEDKSSVAATKTYGTGRIDAYSIMEETLNLRTVTIRDRIDDGGGKYHYEVNKKETMLAREKQNQIKEAFKSWIFKDQARRQKYVAYYNNTFNCIRLRCYDGNFLTFPGMNPEIKLRKHQKDAVARILLGGNTLLAHVVGAGKSYTMIAACMEQKRLGLANKTVIVVPKPLIGQMAGEFMRLYPSANILVATDRDFEKSRRKQFVARMATGDYDGIIMSHSQFEKVPISKERKERMISEQITELSNAIAEMKGQNGEKWTVKQMESQKKKLEQQLKVLTDTSRKDDMICFEELGIDSIMVDEAHHFKNCAVFSKMNNVSGISSAGSQKAADVMLKCQYLMEINEGRGIVFATGTPVSNTMTELYVMQSYLQKKTLERMGIHHFDAWAANFGEVTTALELTVEGSGFRFKSRFNKFTNVPELMNLFREVADVQTADMLMLPVPKLRTGNYIIVDSEPDWFTKQVMEEFVVRAEHIRNGGVDPSVDNFLKITGEAKLLGTDARLLVPDAPDNPDGKLNKVVRNVTAEYFQNNVDGKIGCQLVFSDIGTPKAAWSRDWEEKVKQGACVFDVYNYLKTELVKAGIPDIEIAFVHDAKTDAQRELLFRDIRTGRKRILIGSTEQCGTGVNVQRYLVALHHVDCPWKPSYLEQRDGRGIRQGNLYEEVAIYRYVTKGTFDAYSWSLVENKQRFISQIMTSKAVSRTCEDIDEATLSYSEIKAVATGNPLIKEKMKLENDVQRLKILKNSYDSQKFSLEDNIVIRFPKLIAAATEKANCISEDIKHAEAELIKEPDFSITIGKVRYQERVDGGIAMLEAISKCKMGEITSLGEFKGFALLIDKNGFGVPELILRGKTDHKVNVSTSPVGNMVKLENLIGTMTEELETVKKRQEEYERDLEQSKEEYEKPFEKEAELTMKIARLNELNVQLDLENGKVEDSLIDVKETEQNRVTEEIQYEVRSPGMKKERIL